MAIEPAQVVSTLRERLANGIPICPDSPMAYPPITIEAVENAEKELGFQVPELLRRIYTEVANGWYMKGSELVGLRGGHLNEHEMDAVEDFQEYRSVAKWFDHYLLLCGWGCAMASYLDCSCDDGPVYRWDGNGFDDESESHIANPHDDFWILENVNLSNWILDPPQD